MLIACTLWMYNIIPKFNYTCFDDRPACKTSEMIFWSKHMFLLRFLHRIAVHIAMIAFWSDWATTCRLFLWVRSCFRTFSGLVHSLRIDSRVGAHSSISLMTVSHLKLFKVRGLVFFRTESCLSEHRQRISSRTNLPTLAITQPLTSLWFKHSSAIAILLPRATSLPNFFLVGVRMIDFGFAYPTETCTKVISIMVTDI